MESQALLSEGTDPNAVEKLLKVYERLEQIDAASAEARACTYLSLIISINIVWTRIHT